MPTLRVKILGDSNEDVWYLSSDSDKARLLEKIVAYPNTDYSVTIASTIGDYREFSPDNPLMGKVLKVQRVIPLICLKEGERPCFPTYHTLEDNDKARVMESTITNTTDKIKVVETLEDYRTDLWYEELI